MIYVGSAWDKLVKKKVEPEQKVKKVGEGKQGYDCRQNH